MNKSKLVAGSLVVFALVIFGFILIGGQTVRDYQKSLPSLSQLTNIEPRIVTRVFASDGSVLKDFYSERRILVPLKEIPPYMVDALLSTEDKRFYSHWGVDLIRVPKAFLVNLQRGEWAQGFSTLTQQLSRNLFLTREKTLTRKIKEILTAIKIERTYSKDEILEMYLNQHYFGRGSYGIQAAAQTYFGKNAQELKIEECALLVGLLQAPERYNPFRKPEVATKRRNLVLRNMVNYGKLSEKKADSLKQLPLGLGEGHDDVGLAPYFTEMVRQYLETFYGEDALYERGLKIYTTLNATLQKVAEAAVNSGVDSLQKNMELTHSPEDPNYTILVPETTKVEGKIKIGQKRVYKQLQAAFVAIDNSNGNILGLVGGRDFVLTKFNRAVQAYRQPGSAFKPFVYTAAIESGTKPTDRLFDAPIVINVPGFGEWRPENVDNKFWGEMTVRRGLAWSRNLIAIKLMQKIGAEKAVEYARKMGITSPLKAVPSLAIGTSDCNLLEMVSAYSVFPNLGVKVEPRFILKIEDKDGNVLEQHETTSRKEVLNPQTAYIMVNLMTSVINNGTASAARRAGFDRPAAGKTGTTDDFSDNWFIGYTPQITAGAWVGFDDKTSIGANQTGASNALPIWTSFMLAATQYYPYKDFEIPSGILFRDVDPETGQLATDRCPETIREVFTEKTVPTERCQKHR
ncbi:MAG TPA: PBP1A family penicillin-binding protein [Verrucomicrobiae bacterium]|nr:PBP1A family penicillin-binding protein [Verrucomicrobiae bacterium]